MMYFTLLLSLSVTIISSGGEQTQDSAARPVPDNFFTLRTSELTIYDGMERYDCDNPTCSQLIEIDTFHRVAQLRDGRFLGLRRSGEPALPVNLGTLAEVSAGLTQWPRRTSVPPRTLPEVPNYDFYKAYQVYTTDSYVGLWHRAGGSPGRQTIVVLFDGGNVEASGVPANCGPYRILASVYQRIDLLEVRSVLHLGEAVNLAYYDPGSESIWLAKMLLPDAGADCS